MSKKCVLICDFCNWKSICDFENINLYELKNDTLSNKKYRCPNCGRAITPRKTKDPQSDIEKNNEENKIKEEDEKWIQDNIKFQINFKKEENG
jgi:hypothetical protein